MFRLFFIAVFFSYGTGQALSIEKLYKKAKDYNPSIKRAQLEKTFQEKRLVELKTAFFPTISLNGTYFYGNVPIGDETRQGGLERIDTQNALSLNTTLYNGGAEYTYFKYKSILPELAKNQKDSELFNFFLQLNAFYFNYLNQNRQHALLTKQVKSLKERNLILKKWSAIGRVRKADYLATQAQLKTLESLKQQALENKNVAQLNLKALSGVMVELSDDPINFKKFYSIPSNWEAKAESRPEYKLIESTIADQTQNLTIERSVLRPQVNLFSNLYLNRRQFGRQDDWDVGINLSWSFLDFGTAKSRVAQQEVRLSQLRNNLENTKITLNNEVEILKTQFLSQIKRKNFLKEALKASKENYKEQQSEYKRGLIDALDVNQSLEQLINAELSLETVKHTIAEQWYALKLLSGDIDL